MVIEVACLNCYMSMQKAEYDYEPRKDWDQTGNPSGKIWLTRVELMYIPLTTVLVS